MPLNVLQGPTIDAGAEESHVLALGNDYIVGLVTPAAWTPALVSVMISPDGDNFYDLFDSAGNEFVFKIMPGTAIIIQPESLLCAVFLKLRSGTRKQPVKQTATRRFYTIGSSKSAATAKAGDTT